MTLVTSRLTLTDFKVGVKLFVACLVPVLIKLLCEHAVFFETENEVAVSFQGSCEHTIARNIIPIYMIPLYCFRLVTSWSDVFSKK